MGSAIMHVVFGNCYCFELVFPGVPRPHPQFLKKFVVLGEYILCLNIFLDIIGTAGIAPSQR